MKKTLHNLLALMLLIFVSNASYAETVTFTAGTEMGSSASQNVSDEMTSNGITISCTTAAFALTNHYRIYAGSTLTISSTVGDITSIVFNCTAEGTTKYGPGCLSLPDDGVGTYSYSEKVGTWTGSASSVVFSVGKQVRATSIEVTYTPNGSTAKSDAGLSFSATSASATLGSSDFTAPTLSNPNNLTVTYSSSDESVATVNSSTGVVTLVAAGTTKITATSAETDAYNAGEASYTLTVSEAISGEGGEATFIFNTEEGLADLGLSVPSEGGSTALGDATYTSDNVSLTATSGTTATRVYNSSGTLDLRVYKSGGSLTLSVPSGYSITSIVLDGKSISSITASTGTYSSGTWTGSANSVTLKASEATARINTITVTYEKSGDSTLQDPGLAFSSTTAEATLGEDFTAPTLTNNGDGAVTYTSSDETVATVDENGNVTILAAGTTTITAKSAETSTYAAGTASYTLTVKAAAGELTFETVTLPYEVPFTTGLDKFQADDKELSGLDYVWTYNSSYGAKATAYVSGTNNAAESWLISPYIDMTSATNPTMSFSHAARYFTDVETMKSEATLWARVQGEDTWTQVEIPTYPSNSNWTYVDATPDISAYKGKTVQFAFKYTSTETKAGTWEIKNFVVQDGEAVIEYTDETIASLNEKTANEDNVNLKLNNAQVVYVDANQGVYVREGDKAIQFYKTSLDLPLNAYLTGEVKVNFIYYYGYPEVKDIDGVTNLDGLTITTSETAAEPTATTLSDIAALNHKCDLVKVEGVELISENSKYYAIQGTDTVQLYDKFGTGVLTDMIYDGVKYDLTGIFGTIYKGAAEIYPTALDAYVEADVTNAGYATLYYSEFALSVPDDVTAYTVTAVGNAKATLTEVPNKVIPAGEPVVLEAGSATYKLALTTTEATASSNNMLKGSDVETTTTGDGLHYMLSLKNGENPGFYFGAADGAAFTSKAHKAWLVVESSSAKEFYLFNDATGISTIESLSNGADNNVYNLNGVRVNAEKLQKGIYIKNGKKVIIK